MKKLERSEMRNLKGGLFAGGGLGTCISTCWEQSTGGEPLGSVDVPNCEQSNASKCKDTYPNALKATCSCD
jgi:hypothetical protein